MCVFFVGCANTVARGPDAQIFTGKVIGRTDVPAEPKWAVSEDYTRSMLGAMGVMLAHLEGTPKFFYYKIDTVDGETLDAPAKAEFSLGACVDLVVPKERSDGRRWSLGDVGLEASQGCR
jgi:hypothetical protein